MELSLISVLIIGEAMIILLGLCITLIILLMRKPREVETQEPREETLADAETELDAIDLGNTYIDYIEQEIERNTTKKNQQENIEADIANEVLDAQTDDIDANTDEINNENPDEELEEIELKSPAPSEEQSSLLQAREQFLLVEKEAAEKSEHEIHFWESIYDGITSIIESLASHHTIFSTNNTNITTETTSEGKDKVFYIETQGKKIDGEVNKLKDIIFEQENALSSMKKALKGAGDENPEESDTLAIISEQLEALERQLNDSKMCMEVLEMENDRLQEEVDKMDLSAQSEDADESDSAVDLDQMKEIVDQQNEKIDDLLNTIESLELDAQQAEKLKETIGGFARTSKEMLSCIAILEEENDRLKSSQDGIEDTDDTDVSTEQAPAMENNNEELQTLKSSVSNLEEEIIKKDVAYAQLQDEFSSMETEYLAMYEAMHGDNS